MKTQHSLQSLGLLASVVSALGLAACGGGGGGGEDAGSTPVAVHTTTVPASAMASADAFGSYVNTSAAASMDTAEPLSLAGMDPPTSDTAEPTPLS